jgi:hypothetical protein
MKILNNHGGGYMIICVDDNLVQLYDELKSMGYDAHKMSESIMCDTVIYSGQKSNLSSVYTSLPAGDDRGVFIINGDNIGANEIVDMIKGRAYSSLF